MITPELEKMILRGQADYITFPIGGSGVATLPFPKNARLMIVTDFVWYPFYDQDNMLTGNVYGLMGDLTHTLSLWNGKKKSVINFRDQYSMHRYTPPSPIPTSEQLQTANTAQFFSPYQHHCYITSKQDIFVNIYKFTRAGSINTLYDLVPAVPTNEQAAPNGYVGERAVRTTRFATAQVVNMGLDRDPAAAATVQTGRERNEFYDDISGINTLINPDSVADPLISAYRIPLVNFGLVVINETAPPDIGF